MLPPLPDVALPPLIVISDRSAVTPELTMNPCELLTWIDVTRAPAPAIETLPLSVRAPSVTGNAPGPIVIASLPVFPLAAVTAARSGVQAERALTTVPQEPVASVAGADTW